MAPASTLHVRANGRRLAATIVLLAAVAVGSVATIGQSAGPAMQTITLGRWSHAAVFDPRTGHLFVANDGDGTMSVVDLPSGRVLSTVVVGSDGALAVDAQLHRLAVVSRADNLYRSRVSLLDTRTGALLHSTRVGYAAQALAMDVRRSHLFVANAGDGTVSMLDARTGALLHTSAVGLVPLAVAVDPRAARAVVVSVQTQAPGYEGSGGVVSLLETRTGRVVRTVPVGGALEAVTVDTRSGHAFAVDALDDSVTMLDTRSGAVLAITPVGLFPAAVAVDERRGHLFVANEEDGTVSMLDAASGAVLRTIAVAPHPTTLAVDERRGRVVVASWGPIGQDALPRGRGSVSVLDAASGAVLRTIVVGVAPRSIVVGAPDGRLLVVNGGGAVEPSRGWLDQWIQRLRGWLPWLSRHAPATTIIPGSVTVIDANALS